MLLINGNILASDEITDILPYLEKLVCRTLKKPVLDPMVVVDACDRLAKRFEQGYYNESLKQLITEEHITAGQIKDAVNLFRKESLLYKLEIELGTASDPVKLTPPCQEGSSIQRKRMPLGVLFHIAAGNIDGLPAYSVIEGLLAGNINLLKLPSADHGFTVQILSELIKIEPLLEEYIYVFDTSSNDLNTMKALAKCADAVVVWGGDTAVSSVRSLAAPNTKIIEWGHKISFAYVTEQGLNDEALESLAHHILNTKQLLCSSCQGIFIDTEDMSDVYFFCERFFAILKNAARNYPRPEIGIQAQLTLLRYSKELEAAHGTGRLYHGENCSIIASPDKKLEVSLTYGNCWVKPLSRKNIIGRLHRYKGYLQTAGLLCGFDEREELSGLLLRAGVTRVTGSGDMSRMLCGEAHDGEYPLQRYSRIVEF